MSDSHSFAIAIAKKTSVEQAILLDYFGYWHKQNKANDHNYKNGKYWSYNKLDAFGEIFPYWSIKQIRTVLGHLETAGYIVTEKPGGQDRTTWYALTGKGCEILSIPVDNEPFAQMDKCNIPNGQMDLPKRADASDQTDKWNCPNGQMIYKDTVTEPSITEPLQNTLTEQPRNAEEGEVKASETVDAEKKKKKPPELREAPPSPFGDELPELGKAWALWSDYRKEKGKKAYKPIGLQGAATELMNLSGNNEQQAIAIINQSIAKGWDGFYPLKRDDKQRNNHNGGHNNGTNSRADVDQVADLFGAIDRFVSEKQGG